MFGFSHVTVRVSKMPGKLLRQNVKSTKNVRRFVGNVLEKRGTFFPLLTPSTKALKGVPREGKKKVAGGWQNGSVLSKCTQKARRRLAKCGKIRDGGYFTLCRLENKAFPGFFLLDIPERWREV